MLGLKTAFSYSTEAFRRGHIHGIARPQVRPRQAQRQEGLSLTEDIAFFPIAFTTASIKNEKARSLLTRANFMVKLLRLHSLCLYSYSVTATPHLLNTQHTT